MHPAEEDGVLRKTHMTSSLQNEPHSLMKPNFNQKWLVPLRGPPHKKPKGDQRSFRKLLDIRENQKDCDVLQKN
jgi:hypothetical protein